MPYPGTQVPAVVIAKYYAGAKINGTVFVGDTPFAGATIYAMDEYFGLPHDVGIVKNDGSFELHAPAGNITLHAFLENNDLGNRIEFNTTENPPITEDEALRAVQSNRSVKFQINYSSVDGMINGTENETKLTLKIKNENYNNIEYTQDVAKGEYAFKDLIPSTYRFIITNTTGVEIYNETTFLKPDNNTYNITCTYPPYSPKTINVTEADDNRTIVMKNSDKINLTLLDTDPGNYRWNLTSVNQSAWSLVDRFNSTWILSAKTVGNTSIVAVYEETNNTMNVTKRFAFNFIIEEKPEH
jgi:predicted secreted protein